MSRMVNLESEIARIVDAERPNIRTARSVLANIEDWINSHDADYDGADAGDIVSNLADAIDAYADAADADERADAWEDIVGAANEIPDALEIALDDARAESEWEAASTEPEAVYYTAERDTSTRRLETASVVSALSRAAASIETSERPPTLPEAVEAGFTALWQHDGLRASVEPEPTPEAVSAFPWEPYYCDTCLASPGNCVCPPVEPEPEAVMTAVKCSELNTEWLNTRRGLVGLSRVETPRPAGLSPFVSWIWFTETGETGVVNGVSGRPMAITEAYVSMVRAASPAPVAFPWER